MIIAYVFTFTSVSFSIDFLPALRTKHHESSEAEAEIAMATGTAPSAGFGEGVHGWRDRRIFNGYPTFQTEAGRTLANEPASRNHTNEPGITGQLFP